MDWAWFPYDRCDRWVKKKVQWTVHSPVFFRKIVEIEPSAILHERQNYLGGRGGLGGSEKNRGTVITSL